jgi:hypothetical protein
VVEQDSLIFREGEVWERRDNEPSRAYAAFQVFRDIGVGRSLLEAYKRWRKEEDGAPEGEAPRLGVEKQDGIYPASNWRRWREKWDWDKRATAWDDAQRKEVEDRKARARAAQWEAKQKQYEELQKRHYDRLIRVNDMIDGTLKSAQPLSTGGDPIVLPKARTETESNGKISITEMDLIRQLEILCEEERSLNDSYFAGINDVMESDQEGQKTMTAVIGEFRWVPDPSLTDVSLEPSSIVPTPANTSFIDVTPDSKD